MTSQPDLRLLTAIFAGGFAGALARVEVTRLLPHDPGAWPWATFVVNVAGTFVLGWVVVRLQERLPPSTYRRPFVGTGVCGALTTFSTLQLDLLAMVDEARIGLAVAYALASIGAGLVAMWLAVALARGTPVAA